MKARETGDEMEREGWMRAVEVAEGGGPPEALRPVWRERPKAAEGEVLIRVKAAGVNGHDLGHRRRGSHPIGPGESDLPGLEVSGEIAAIGGDVSAWRVGDAVCALLRGGGYAQYAVAKQGQCLPVPSGYSWVEAAALPETAFTVWSNLFIDAGLRPGQTFLMNGGTSGIGVTAIQIASALGVTVLATARGPDKCAAALANGAAHVIDYEAEDVGEAVRRLTQGRGVNVVLDIVGGDSIPMAVASLAQNGVLIMIGAAKGSLATVDFGPVYRKALTITGSLLRPRPVDFKARVAAELLEQVWPLYAARRIQPVIDSTYPLEQAALSHARLESRAHIGKVVLTAD
jgi:NADPH2:quinone reductase